MYVRCDFCLHFHESLSRCRLAIVVSPATVLPDELVIRWQVQERKGKKRRELTAIRSRILLALRDVSFKSQRDWHRENHYYS